MPRSWRSACRSLCGLFCVAPWWLDCTAPTVDRSRARAAEYLEDLPGLPADRDRAAAALGPDLPDEATVPSRLCEVALGVGKDHVLVRGPEGDPYEPLFGARP